MTTLQQTHDTWSTLSDQEIRILQATADGRTCQQTADELGLNVKTIGTYRHYIIQKLRAGNIAGAVAKAIREGVIK